MNYAEMSDFEINELVAAAMGIATAGTSRFVLYIKDGIWTEFNPCNNPADSWPIIVEELISTRPVGEDGCLWEASGINGVKADYDKNPLRAAMVVFLMMMEGEGK